MEKVETLNLEQLIQSKYVIPLYQRNFAWGEEQIVRLIQDIKESISSGEKQYFIGTLVVITRRNGHFEVIDGQQRLTILTLLSFVLHLDTAPSIQYDSRPEVEECLTKLRNGTKIKSPDSSISHFINATTIIEQEVNKMNDDEKNYFSTFVREQLCVIREIMPADTDVATYFEIMNNRGEQLQEHEIMKGLLLEKAFNDYGLHVCNVCSIIWDACSQMDERIQKSFTKSIRECLFGEDYSNLLLNENNAQDVIAGMSIANKLTNQKSLEEIFETKDENVSPEMPNTDDEDMPDADIEETIIDFPNFIMHVLKLYYNEKYKKYTKPDNDIPLYDSYLLKVFRTIKDEIDPIIFIYYLLRCRTILDRYIVKTNFVNDNDEEGRKWRLAKPQKAIGHNEKSKLSFVPTFEEKNMQDTIVKALSCIQVSHPSRYRKNYLQHILKWFVDKPIDISASMFQQMLNDFIYNEFSSVSLPFLGIKEYTPNCQGTKVNHIMLSYIDYFIWLAHIKQMKFGEEKEWNEVMSLKDFRFQYWNSIEHHYPQQRTSDFSNEKVDDYHLNCLGNIFLIGKSTNSRLSDKNPIDKATLYRDKPNMAPNRQLIYNITMADNWGRVQIDSHLHFVESLCCHVKEILNV